MQTSAMHVENSCKWPQSVLLPILAEPVAEAILREEKTLPVRTERCAGTQRAEMLRPKNHPEWFKPLLHAWLNLLPSVRTWKGWWVILRGGDETCHIRHNHHKYDISSVFYPAVPLMEGGDLAFDDFWLKPETGLLVSFPGTVYHYVVPHNSPKPRISVSLNAKYG